MTACKAFVCTLALALLFAMAQAKANPIVMLNFSGTILEGYDSSKLFGGGALAGDAFSAVFTLHPINPEKDDCGYDSRNWCSSGALARTSVDFVLTVSRDGKGFTQDFMAPISAASSIDTKYDLLYLRFDDKFTAAAVSPKEEESKLGERLSDAATARAMLRLTRLLRLVSDADLSTSADARDSDGKLIDAGQRDKRSDSAGLIKSRFFEFGANLPNVNLDFTGIAPAQYTSEEYLRRYSGTYLGDFRRLRVKTDASLMSAAPEPVASIPEPPTVLLFGAGLLVLSGLRYIRMQRGSRVAVDRATSN